MIGNDVIDLEAAAIESNPFRPGYLDKIFNDSEQLLIHGSENPEKTIWILWSMKEAAYKIFNRSTGIRNFDPSGFSCEITAMSSSFAKGIVFYREKTYLCRSEIREKYIHTIALLDDSFDKVADVSVKDVRKVGHLPQLSVHSAFKTVSVSHHGSYTRAVAI